MRLLVEVEEEGRAWKVKSIARHPARRRPIGFPRSECGGLARGTDSRGDGAASSSRGWR
jgi:hypothetical protein